VDVSPNDGGTVDVDQSAPSSYPDTSAFNSGANVSLEAVPAPGYVFSNWSGDLSNETNPATILMNCNKNIRANFSKTGYALNIQVNGSGSTTPEAGSSDYSEGQQVTITAAPAHGWQFDGWAGDVADSKSSIIMVTMDSDKTIIATFSKQTKWSAFVPAAFGGILILSLIVVLIKRLRTH